jgi:hypothetical protein
MKKGPIFFTDQTDCVKKKIFSRSDLAKFSFMNNPTLSSEIQNKSIHVIRSSDGEPIIYVFNLGFLPEKPILKKGQHVLFQTRILNRAFTSILSKVLFGTIHASFSNEMSASSRENVWTSTWMTDYLNIDVYFPVVYVPDQLNVSFTMRSYEFLDSNSIEITGMLSIDLENAYASPNVTYPMILVDFEEKPGMYGGLLL